MRNYKQELENLFKDMLADEKTTFFVEFGEFPIAKTEDDVRIQLFDSNNYACLQTSVHIGEDVRKYVEKAKQTVSQEEIQSKIDSLKNRLRTWKI